LLQGSPNLAFSHKNIKVKNFAVDIDYDMVWVVYAAKNLIIYEWKATYHFTKKRLYTETIELIELGCARVLSYATADFIDRNIL
jgi:hypothetical protein